MASRRTWEKARGPYWSLHVEAWRQSGLNRTEYCRHHGLSKNTFDRWMKHLISKEDARKHAEYQAELRRQKRRDERAKAVRKRQRRRHAVSTDMRSRAVQAFWAMHVEAMNWSGMGVREYAAGLHLSPYSLRKWRDRLHDGEVEIDWRAHLHPSARPVVGTSASKPRLESDLTGPSKDLRRPLTLRTAPPSGDREARRAGDTEVCIAGFADFRVGASRAIATRPRRAVENAFGRSDAPCLTRGFCPNREREVASEEDVALDPHAERQTDKGQFLEREIA